MESTRYSREGNTILFAESENMTPAKVAVINKAGVLQPSKGMGHHLDAIKAFLADIGDEIEPPAADIMTKSFDIVHNFTSLAFAKEFADEWNGLVLGGPTPIAPFQVRNSFPTEQYLRQFRAEARAWLDEKATKDPDDTIPPCPPEDPAAGDKTPAVVAWWHRYHPQEAAIRYKGRRFTMPEGI